MKPTDALITHVSDTARWVAAYRAEESARFDAIFRDPLASKLAGDRGRKIVKATPWFMRNGWLLIARTAVLDEVIRTSIEDGCDRILNLAAGFDTRPYRLDLPPGLRWVEADLPDLVKEKESILADESPNCVLERHSVDLSDPQELAKFLDFALSGADRALIITEGLLIYLDEDSILEMATQFGRSEVAWWAFDISNSSVVAIMNRWSGSLLDRTPFKFGPADPDSYMSSLGWKVIDSFSLIDAAQHMNRLPTSLKILNRLAGFLSSAPWSGVVRSTRRDALN